MFKAFGCTTLICEYDQSTGLQPTKRGWKTWQIQRPAKQYNISKKRPVPKHDEHPAYFFKTLSVSLMLDVQMLLPWAKWCLKLKSSSKWLTCIESGAVQSRGKEVGVKNTLCPQKRAYCDLKTCYEFVLLLFSWLLCQDQTLQRCPLLFVSEFSFCQCKHCMFAVKTNNTLNCP